MEATDEPTEVDSSGKEVVKIQDDEITVEVTDEPTEGDSSGKEVVKIQKDESNVVAKIEATDEPMEVDSSGKEVVKIQDDETNVEAKIEATDEPTEVDSSRKEVVKIQEDEINGDYVKPAWLIFDLDEEPKENEDKTPEEITYSHLGDTVPLYDSPFTGILTTKEFSMETGKHLRNDAIPKKQCFNCLDDHNISDCPQPHDPIAINRNKKSILKTRLPNRYHLDAENKYSHFQPGRASSNLRHALGLRRHQLPRYIYHMRQLGYPLGWLKTAEVTRADVSLIDGEGKVLSHPEDEEGETDVSHVKYEPEKLIRYPGFNSPLDSDTEEECGMLGFPPMNRMHSVGEFEKQMTSNRASKYKKKKLKTSDTPSHSSNTVSMELDNDAEVSPAKIEVNLLPALNASEVPSSPSNLKKEEGELSEDSNNSQENETSANDENNSKKDQDHDSNSTTDTSDDKRTVKCNLSVKRKEPPEDSDDSHLSESSAVTEDSKDSMLLSESSAGAVKPSNRFVKRHHRSKSKGFMLGVPVPKSISAFPSLPDAVKWGVDICDHINFENLPDALGTWNKMKGLITKVKDKMIAIHKDE